MMKGELRRNGNLDSDTEAGKLKGIIVNERGETFKRHLIEVSRSIEMPPE